MYHVVFSEVIAVVVKGKEDSSKGPEDKEGGEEENQNQPTITHDSLHSGDVVLAVRLISVYWMLLLSVRMISVY